MKFFIFISILIGLFYSIIAQAEYIEKGVYGFDGRLEAFESKFSQYALSIAAKIPTDNLMKTKEGYELLRTKQTLGLAQNLCPEERFISQPSMSECTAFLVAPNLLMTAGHCIESIDECAYYSWVFNYKMLNTNEVKKKYSFDEVYSCIDIVSRGFSKSIDYAIVRLERDVKNTPILKIRREGILSQNPDLIVVGHPSGIPSKISEGGTIRMNDPQNPMFFVANLDSFYGNSGSPVIDVKSGLVEGILVRGGSDYIKDETRSCYKVNTLPEGSGRGEDVTRVAPLAHFIAL